MGFREHLKSMIEGVEGAVAASVMGFDGIPIDTVESTASAGSANDIDIQTMLIEYSNILSQLRRAADILQSGEVTEISVNTEKLTTFARLLSNDYFAVLAILPGANYGKARYTLRLTVPKFIEEL